MLHHGSRKGVGETPEVGTAGFEPAFSCVRGTRPFRAGPRPELVTVQVAQAGQLWCVYLSATGPSKRSRRESNPHALAGTRFRAGIVCMLLPSGTVARAPSGSRTRTSAMARQQAAATSWVLVTVSRLSRIRPTKKARGRVTPGLQRASPATDQESKSQREDGRRRARPSDLLRHERPAIRVSATHGHRCLPLRFVSSKCVVFCVAHREDVTSVARFTIFFLRLLQIVAAIGSVPRSRSKPGSSISRNGRATGSRPEQARCRQSRSG